MIPHRIVAPVTFAEDSLEAVAVAATLAAAVGAELVLAGIAPLAPPDPPPEAPGGIDMLARQAEQQKLLDRIIAKRLEEVADALPAGISTRTLLTWGPVGAALVAAAREQRADLVVVPIRRESELAHLIHDHADRYVLHHSDVPVLVVPTNGRGPRNTSSATSSS
jgi:nucleotide-binding universal stress UspA family protein